MVGDDERITEMMRNELNAVRYTLRELQDVVLTKERAGVNVLPITYKSIEALVNQVESLEMAIAERVSIKKSGVLSRLSEDELRVSDRIFAWLLILFGYVIAMTMSLDHSGWSDPVFRIVRKVPGTPFSWAAVLAVAVTVYAAGELISEFKRRRGFLVVAGSLMCACWNMAMCLAMSRMVYEMPTRITTLWPMVMFFMTCLYASRAVVYSNTFTGFRWSTTPYQAWGVLMVMLTSLSQIVIGVAPGSVLHEISRPIVLQLAVVNFMSASVMMFGMHMRDKEIGINLEMFGGITLFAIVTWQCVNELNHDSLVGSTLGFALSESFAFATLHHTIQIAALKWARWRERPRMARRLGEALKHEQTLVVAEPVPVEVCDGDPVGPDGEISGRDSKGGG